MSWARNLLQALAVLFTTMVMISQSAAMVPVSIEQQLETISKAFPQSTSISEKAAPFRRQSAGQNRLQR